MGWKISATFIKDAGNLEINDDLIKSLGFKDFEYIEKTNFNENPEIGELYVSKYNNHLLIANADLIWEFTKPNISKTEKTFIEKFPNTEIYSLSLGGGTYFSLIENGKKIRLREVGDEIYQDVGELISEEIYLKSENLFDEDELEFMKNELTEEEFEQQLQSNLAYETAFELTKRFFGKRYDELEIKDYEFESLKYRNFLIDNVQDYGIKAEMQFEK
ncbi:hypothetical protein [Flavobacterium sp. Root186]|uniref:hypothetical protein n=1 Tax=Flavobacterium sp. Root186 TaxID=1736485 RepID=UPI0006FC0830|nr:hypothetical protein [Flavobacterium sp. Root186]KRB58131.1 hypothetical protein ASD98_07685 [Flavobacterium sp. Root186]